MAKRAPAEIGELIRGYRLERLLAKGGMGSVYVGRHEVLGRAAAIKILDPSLASNAEYVGRFMQEARVVNDVRHPNIVDIFDFIEQDSPRRVAFVMEMLDGPTLEEVVTGTPLTPLQAFNVAHQLVSALSMVHSRGVIHRDLKPSNIIVIGNPTSPLAVVPSVKILDFGIAKIFEANVNETGPGQMLGTPAYMAPEQVSGEVVSAATDVYAFAEILYEMLTGERAFMGNARQVIKLKMIGQIPDIELGAHIPGREKLSDLMHRALSSEASRRPPLEDFESVIHEARLSALPSFPSPPPQSRDEIDVESVTTPSEEFDALETTPVEQAASESDGEVRRLGDYSLFIALPPRGMTQSYVARRDGKIEICVLRRLLRQLESNSTATARFRREAKITRYLRHPRIARLLDARLIDGTFCIANELVLGVTLETVLSRLVASNRQMPIHVFAPIAVGVLDALNYAHDATDEHGRPLGIVHRDLTPSSVSLSFSGDVKLSDFGIARASVDDFRTAPGTAVGSLEYMSPEQVRSEDVDRRSDIYTTAALMFEALSGRKLIEPKGMLETLRSVTTDVPPPLTTLRPDVGKDLADVIERGLAKRAEDRYSTAAEMSAALRGALGPIASATRDTVGDFVRQLMPDEEQRTLAMLSEIRAVGEKATRAASQEPQPADEPTMTVRQRTLRPAEAPEPDLLTMPGAPAPLEERTSSAIPNLQPRRPPPSPSAAPKKTKVAPAVLVSAVVLAIVATATVVAFSMADRPAAQPADQPVVASQNEARGPRIEAKAVPEPDPTKAVAKVVPTKTVPTKTVPTKTVSAKTTSSKTTRVGPSKAPPPPAAPPPAAPPPPPRPVNAFSDISRSLQKLRGNPSDVALFDRVHDKIWAQAQSLPEEMRRRVKIKLDAAQRTYAVTDLEAALDRLKIATAKSKS